FLNEYYAKFIPIKSIESPCTQTRDHIIQCYEIYSDYQDPLWDVSDNLDMGKILGTEEGIEALLEYIKKAELLGRRVE
ncbi:hypothetical protein J3R30DRAFT_3299228, partial [Lentinula aciculospora]